jgi:predicted dehydrogenase
VHGTEGSYLKYGTDPQEEQLKAGLRPTGRDWGREPETEWGYLNADIEGNHYQGKYETLQGDYRQFYNNIYTVLREGGDLLVTAGEANLVVRVIEAAMESSRSGNRVALTG